MAAAGTLLRSEIHLHSYGSGHLIEPSQPQLNHYLPEDLKSHREEETSHIILKATFSQLHTKSTNQEPSSLVCLYLMLILASLTIKD